MPLFRSVRVVLRHLTLSPLLAICLCFNGLSPVARADYCYAWTELSLEWVTDASSAIALGEVLETEKGGAFSFRVDAVLKNAPDFSLGDGQAIKGACLGRATIDEHRVVDVNRVPLFSARPIFSEPSTYPGNNCAIPPTSLPALQRQPDWGKGDKCILFFGQDVKSVIQIINLDRPLLWQTDDLENDKPFLAADLNGKVIGTREEVLVRIKLRVEEGRKQTADGWPKVCYHGFSHGGNGSELDAQDYFFVFAPPDATFKEQTKRAIRPELLPYAYAGRDVDVRNDQLDVWAENCVQREAMEKWYWFYSGRTPEFFAAERQRDFEHAFHSMRKNKYDLSGQVRKTYVSFRNLPRGWWCAISPGDEFFAYIDVSHLYLYGVTYRVMRPQAAAPLYKTSTVDRLTSQLSFSPKSSYLAYTDRDGALTVFDLSERRVAWKSKLPLSYSGIIDCTQLCFSGDEKFLAQVVVQGLSRQQSNVDRALVYVWDVASGKCLFTPYEEWQPSLRVIDFDKQDSRLIRLTNPRSENGTPEDRRDLIWNLETCKVDSQSKESTIAVSPEEQSRNYSYLGLSSPGTWRKWYNPGNP